MIALVAASLGLGRSLGYIQSAYPGLPPDVPLAADKSYGVNADLTAYPPEALDHALARMSNLGLRWIRQPFPWADIEPVRGQFDWERWDRVVQAAGRHGLNVIAVLDTAPAWARPPDTGPFTPPTELADFGAFARALARRYGDQLHHYQIWDEPNLSAHWGGRFVDPAAYAHLLREGAVNIRAADARAVVLTAALAPTVESGPLNLNEPDFLAGVYAADTTPWFDIVAAQPYGFDVEPGAPAGRGKLNFARATLLRQTMAAYGDGSKAIWATAFGWSTLPPDWAGRPSPWPSLLPEQQAAYTAQAIRQARANWPWLGPMLFAAWDTEMLPADDPRRGLALIAGEARLPQAVTLGGGIATLGVYPADHPSGHTSGDWRFSPAGADVPRQPPARLTIPFEGTRLDLTVRRGYFRGFLYVTIDGQPANSLPQQAGHAYVVLYDPLEKVETVTLARYLPDGPHTAVIEAEGGWYQWPVVSWRVSREGDTRTIGLGLILVGALAVVAAGGLVFSARRLPWRWLLLRRWLWSCGERLNARYRALGTPIHLLILVTTALAFYFVPGTLPSLGLLGLFFLAILPRPDLGLALIAFSLPFFLLPKSLIGRTISMTEVSLVLVALACVVRRVLTPSTEWAGAKLASTKEMRAGARPAPTPVARRLDWVAWGLTGIALVGGLLTVIPAANVGLLASADWPAMSLMLLPLAGVLAVVSERQGEAETRGHGDMGNQRIRESGSGRSSEEGIIRLADWLTRRLDLAVVALVGLAFAATLAAENSSVSNLEFHVVIWDAAAFYAFVRLLPDLSQVRNPFSHRKRVSEDTTSPKALSFRGGQPATAPSQPVTWSVVDAWLLGAALMAGYAIYQFFFTNLAITAEGVQRTLGVYGSPNNLALLLDRAAPVLIALAAFGQVRRKQMLYGLALILTLAALVLTFSRGALLLGLPAAVLFIGLVRGGRALWAALGVLAAGGVGMLPLFGTDRFRSLLDTSAGTGFFRLRLWQSAWAMLHDHPWLGVGLDNFLYQYRTRYISPDAWQEPNLSHPHNILLDFATRLGVGGVIVLLWLQLAFWRTAWPLYRRLPEGAEKALTMGLMASMVATLAHGLVDQSFFLVDLAFIFALTLGAVGRLND